MKKIISSVIVMVAFLLGPGAAMAQNGDSGLKIAVLNMSDALLNSEVAKVVDQELKEETAEDTEKVKNLAEQAQKLQNQLQQDKDVLSEAEQRRIVGELQELQNQYQFLYNKIQKLLNDRRQQFQQTYAPNLVQAISEVVEEGGYDIVFRAEAILHFDNVYDITARVTEKLNQQK